jgi:predicted trehalose synthase
LGEPGPRSATLVTIRPDRSVQVEERFTSVAQLQRITLDITGVEGWEELVQRITQALEQARRPIPSGHLVTRLVLTGATPLAWRIRKHLDDLTAEARERARVIGNCWVEKIEVAIALPAADKEPCEPMLQLKRLMVQDVMHSDSVRTQLSALCELLRRQLPAECREALGADQAAFEQQLTILAREGIEDVLARLHADTPRAG